jgi:hypothetical protein
MVTKALNTTLIIDRATVISKMGYRDRTPPEMIIRRIDEQIENALKLVTPMYSYRFRKIVNITVPGFELEGGLTFSSQTVSYALDGCREAAMYLATLGPGLEQEIIRLFTEKQTISGAILDTVGSVVINQTLRQLRADVKIGAEEMGLQATRHYGPGHCDWDIAQQKILFPALENGELGVHLNEACMMTPRKSITGIIGIGKLDKNKTAPCNLFCKKAATCEYRNI